MTASFQIVPGMNAVTIPAEAQKRMEGVEQGVTFMQYFFFGIVEERGQSINFRYTCPPGFWEGRCLGDVWCGA